MHKRKDSRVPNFQTFQLGVPCIGPVTPDCGAFVVKELFKHFLYMRSQLPQVFDQLLWQYQVMAHLLYFIFLSGGPCWITARNNVI